jgi:hypothetical protein
MHFFRAECLQLERYTCRMHSSLLPPPTTLARALIQKPQRWRMLMDLYDRNFERLRTLLPKWRGTRVAFESDLGADGALKLTPIAEEAHTSVIHLSHIKGVAAPHAFVRVYHDAQQAEITHFEHGSELKKLFSSELDHQLLVHRRLRLNLFFAKWLDFLEAVGHHANSWRAIPLEHE